MDILATICDDKIVGEVLLPGNVLQELLTLFFK